MIITDNVRLLICDKFDVDALSKEKFKAEFSYIFKDHSDIDNISKFRNVFNLFRDKSFFYMKNYIFRK